MYCSPLLPTDPTRLPAGVRNWIGRRLSGPRHHGAAHKRMACIHKVDRLGDFVLALSAIRLLLDHFRREQCTLVVSDLAAPLAVREFPDAHLIILPADAPGVLRQLVPAWWRDRPRLGGVRYGLNICLSQQRDLYKEVSLTWVEAEREIRLTRADYPTAAKAFLPFDLLAHQQIVSMVLGRPVSGVEITPGLQSAVAEDHGTLLLCPLSSSPLRTLPPALVAASLQVWRGRRPITLCGSPAQAKRLHAYAAQLTAAGAGGVSLSLPPTLDEFIKLVASAGLFLGTESGGAHLAAALDQRAVIVLGGGTPGLCMPWRRSARQIYVQHELPCNGCGWRCSRPDVDCLKQISPDALARALHGAAAI
jgi:ADP-heptose:LPS heptosyltransferase